jgi:hypothetical protein
LAISKKKRYQILNNNKKTARGATAEIRSFSFVPWNLIWIMPAQGSGEDLIFSSIAFSPAASEL